MCCNQLVYFFFISLADIFYCQQSGKLWHTIEHFHKTNNYCFIYSVNGNFSYKEKLQKNVMMFLDDLW